LITAPGEIGATSRVVEGLLPAVEARCGLMGDGPNIGREMGREAEGSVQALK